MKFPSFAKKAAAPSSFGGGGSPSEFLGGALGELSCNSPSGPIRLGRGSKGITKGARGSPYDKKAGRGGKRGGGSLLSVGTGYDATSHEPLFMPRPVTGSATSQYTANKVVVVKKPATASGGCVPSIGLKFYKEGPNGAVIIGEFTEALSAAERAGLLVGDVVSQIDGKDVASTAEAAWMVNEAAPGASIYFQIAGGTRQVVLDKRCGDCGMTCAAARVARGVLLKRIAAGSLADHAKLYPGDTILAVNGVLVHHHADAVAQIDACKDVVKLVVLGESRELCVPLGDTSDGSFGLTLRDHEAVGDGAGVVVAEVTAGGTCAAQGLTAGDLVLAVNGVLCTDHAQAMGLIEQVKEMANNPFAEPSAQANEVRLVVQSKYAGRH